MHNPIVIDPPDFDQKKAWGECQNYADRMHAAGRPFAAAAGADPGLCSCPVCDAMHWAWGNRQRCTQCGFEYPTQWWPRYSSGVSAGRAAARGYKDNTYTHERNMADPAYRYGFEHVVDDVIAERERIDWRSVLAGD